MSEIVYQALAGLVLFLLGIAATFGVSYARRAKSAEAKAAMAEGRARTAEGALADKKEEERVEELSDDEVDREARDLGVLSNRRPKRDAVEHTNPPPGFAPCTRADGHDGPCAHPLKHDA